MQKYLIIGGTGVMGHYLTRLLVQQGHRPVVLTVSGNTALVADLLGEIDLVRGDVTDSQGLNQVVAQHGITHLAHLGALLDTEADQNPLKAVRVGVEGMVNVMEAARRHKIQRVVYISSKDIYGRIRGEYWHPTYKPVPEDYPTVADALNMYGIVKLAGEHLGLWYQRQYGIEFIALRFASTVGPGKLRRHGLFVHHSRMIENAMADRPTHLPQGADALHDPIYNADCARGILSGPRRSQALRIRLQHRSRIRHHPAGLRRRRCGGPPWSRDRHRTRPHLLSSGVAAVQLRP